MAVQQSVLQVQSQRLRAVPVSAWVLFRDSAFLSQLQNTHVRQIQNCMLAVVAGANAFLCGPALNWQLAQGVTTPGPGFSILQSREEVTIKKKRG